MKRSCLSSAFAVAVAMSFFAVEAFAQVQTSGQQKCLNKISGGARKITSSVLRNSADCMKRGANGTLPPGMTAEACLAADLKGKVTKARDKVDAGSLSYCEPPNNPDFGYTDPFTIGDSYEYESVSLLPDFFGNLDAALAGPLAGDQAAKCSGSTIAMSGKLADAMLKEYLACMKSGLKAKSLTGAAGLEACLDSITDDLNGRVMKGITRVQGKIASSCPASPADYFPELDDAGELCDRYGIALPLDAASLATCISKRLKCRVCRTMNGAANLERDCDEFDDGSVDGTCPQCPNGVVDAGEECDDDNTSNADACVGMCANAFCGDGFVRSGIEDCDDGPGNSDTEPNACRTDCTLPSCGDGAVDTGLGEQCDEGAVNTATCDADCSLPVCHDGTLNTLAGEQCDDGNVDNTDACVGDCVAATCGDGYVHSGFEVCDGGECCTGLCVYAPLGTSCSGTAGECVAPLCNGSGTCLELPANEGGTCDDGSVCSASSTCQSGTCTADVYSGVGLACDWVVVGAPAHSTEMVSMNAMQSPGSGDWCGLQGDFSVSSVFTGDIVATGNNGSGRAIRFADLITVNNGDIVTNSFRVDSTLIGINLPGLTGVYTIGPGQHVNKTPAPTFYDTTGTDPRIARCQAAQASIATTKATLNSLVATANLGATYFDLPSGAAPPFTAINVGGVNVFDLTNLNGTAANVTLTFDGGGSTDTVMVIRISDRLNTGANWTFNLTNGMTANHLLFHVKKTTGIENCALGLNNVGAGTLFCPDQQVHVNSGAIWSGAAYGGDSGSKGEVRIGEGAQFTYAPFTAALP